MICYIESYGRKQVLLYRDCDYWAITPIGHYGLMLPLYTTNRRRSGHISAFSVNASCAQLVENDQRSHSMYLVMHIKIH